MFDREHLDIPLPSYLAVEHLRDWRCDDVRGVKAMDGLDRFAQFRKVVAHG
jgi:hypothetical protein